MRWCWDGDFWQLFCVLYFQRAARSTFQTCILNLHEDHTMCQSMVDIQSPTAEIRRGKKRKKKERRNRMKIYMVSLFHRATINDHTEKAVEWPTICTLSTKTKGVTIYLRIQLVFSHWWHHYRLSSEINSHWQPFQQQLKTILFRTSFVEDGNTSAASHVTI